MQMPIVVGLGGGVDSVEATLDLLRDPIALRYLRQGAVMMAQTGHEWPDTKRDLEEVLFPRLAAARVRTIQVARRGLLKSAGPVVLDDTDQPTVCHTRPTPGGGTSPSAGRCCWQARSRRFPDRANAASAPRGPRWMRCASSGSPAAAPTCT
ncbi:MAG TPA: hypothetical protein VFV66_02250 [Nonomuraea sp.]|nr:hypothetical protein [Nonomuraea sp.]